MHTFRDMLLVAPFAGVWIEIFSYRTRIKARNLRFEDTKQEKKDQLQSKTEMKKTKAENARLFFLCPKL